MADLPIYLSKLFDKLYQSKCLLNDSHFKVVIFIMLTHFSGLANASQNDSDGDGLTDIYELKIGSESYLSDTDGDEVKDGDEIGGNQNTPRDTDKDGVIDALDYDDDGDGLPTYLESKIDTDKDGLLDYLDKDSDNDGITDGEEAGFLNQDKNQDGIDDAFDINLDGAVDNNGDGIDDNLKLPDHNNDGKPDYLDPKFQNTKTVVVEKKLKKAESNKIVKTKEKAKNKKQLDKKVAVEKLDPVITDKVPTKISKSIKLEKPTQSPKPTDMIVNRHTDSDNDGLSNSLEKKLGTNHLNRDSDGDKVSDAIEIGLDINSPQDSDRDGIIDALDDDDDNDGVLTKFEDLNKDSTAINDDTDADGVPNYLDANDDGDNFLTKAEGSTKDSDGDGILDYLDKNDGLKDISNSTNKAVQSKDKMIPKEPEIVVLFDGDASALTEDDETTLDEMESEESVQDTILSSLEEVTQSNELVESKKDEIIPSKSTSKQATSHWNLF